MADCGYCENRDDCQRIMPFGDCVGFIPSDDWEDAKETFEHHWEMMDDIERGEWDAESEDKE